MFATSENECLYTEDQKELIIRQKVHLTVLISAILRSDILPSWQWQAKGRGMRQTISEAYLHIEKVEPVSQFTERES